MIAHFGEFTLDVDQRRLSRQGVDVHLTPKAFDLLALLVEHSPRVMRKAEMHDRLWPGTFVSDATLVGLVKELRRALSVQDSRPPFVRTVHRVGYAFSGPLEDVTPDTSGMRRWIVAGDRRIALSDGENVIGRDPASAIWLDAAGVSRRHARILVRDRDALLEDLGSKNGTVVRDQLISGPVALRDADRIRVGPILIVYRASPAGVSTETMAGGPAV
ncbi:MAG TPA: FHA domain-containing protein [Vicinamibacterales bacterium]|nr:FHA domain-containing protein [Vicinamibacterales bacterium]